MEGLRFKSVMRKTDANRPDPLKRVLQLIAESESNSRLAPTRYCTARALPSYKSPDISS